MTWWKTHDELRHIFVEVADGRGRHSAFLKNFAAAFVAADEENTAILHVAALMLVEKYRLEKYLDNYTQPKET